MTEPFAWSPMSRDCTGADGRLTVTGPLFISALKLLCFDPKIPLQEFAKRLQEDRAMFVVNNHVLLDELLIHVTQISPLWAVPGWELPAPALLLPGTPVELRSDSPLPLSAAWKIRRLTAAEILNILEKCPCPKRDPNK